MGAAGFETDGRVFVDQSSRLLHACSLCHSRLARRCRQDRHARGVERCVHANLQPRHHRGCAFLFRWLAGTTAAACADIDDFGGLMQRTPLLCGWMSVAMFSSLGSAGTERIHRRVFDFQRLVRDRSRVYGHCGDRASCHSHRLCARYAIPVQRAAGRKLQRFSRSSATRKARDCPCDIAHVRHRHRTAVPVQHFQHNCRSLGAIVWLNVHANEQRDQRAFSIRPYVLPCG